MSNFTLSYSYTTVFELFNKEIIILTTVTSLTLGEFSLAGFLFWFVQLRNESSPLLLHFLYKFPNQTHRYFNRRCFYTSLKKIGVAPGRSL